MQPYFSDVSEPRYAKIRFLGSVAATHTRFASGDNGAADTEPGHLCFGIEIAPRREGGTKV